MGKSPSGVLMGNPKTTHEKIEGKTAAVEKIKQKVQDAGVIIK